MERKVKKGEKWYYSYPILLLTMFLYPVSLILTILRWKGIKDQSGGYKVRSKIAFGIHIGLLILITFGGWISYQETKWVKEYEQYMETGNYEMAKEMLENSNSGMTASMVIRYLDLYEKTGDFSGIGSVITNYYEQLDEKEQFSEIVGSRVNEIWEQLSEEQQTIISMILKEVEELKKAQEAATQSEAARKAAEKESIEESRRNEEAIKESEKAKKEPIKEQETERVSETASESTEILSESTKEIEISEQELQQTQVQIDEYITEYLGSPNNKTLKKLKKEDESIVKAILKQRMKDYIEQTDSWKKTDRYCIQDYCDLYQELYLVEEIQSIVESLKKLETLEKRKDQVDHLTIGEERFDVGEVIRNLQWGEWYVTQRLETHYEDSLTGSIKKGLDSMNRSSGSSWVAYDVEYRYGEAYPGDMEIVLFSEEDSPFPQRGAYSVNYLVSSKQKSLIDGKGFTRKVPVYYLIGDSNAVYEAYYELQEIQENIEIEVNKMYCELGGERRSIAGNPQEQGSLDAAYDFPAWSASDIGSWYSPTTGYFVIPFIDDSGNAAVEFATENTTAYYASVYYADGTSATENESGGLIYQGLIYPATKEGTKDIMGMIELTWDSLEKIEFLTVKMIDGNQMTDVSMVSDDYVYYGIVD